MALQKRHILINLPLGNNPELAEDYLNRVDNHWFCRRIIYFYVEEDKECQGDYVLVLLFSTTINRMSTIIEWMELLTTTLDIMQIPMQIDYDKFWLVWNPKVPNKLQHGFRTIQGEMNDWMTKKLISDYGN